MPRWRNFAGNRIRLSGGGRMNDGVCCCGPNVSCGACPDNTAPGEMVFTVSGITNGPGCEGCSDLDGTYVLPYSVSESGTGVGVTTCVYTLLVPASNPFNFRCEPIRRVYGYIQVVSDGINPTRYFILVQFQYFDGFTYQQSMNWNWVDAGTTTQPECSGVYELEAAGLNVGDCVTSATTATVTL